MVEPAKLKTKQKKNKKKNETLEHADLVSECQKYYSLGSSILKPFWVEDGPVTPKQSCIGPAEDIRLPIRYPIYLPIRSLLFCLSLIQWFYLLLLNSFIVDLTTNQITCMLTQSLTQSLCSFTFIKVAQIRKSLTRS